MTKLTTEEFIKKAREVHGDRYEYSKVEYVTSKTKIILFCLKHGEFPQSPQSNCWERAYILCKWQGKRIDED